LDKLDAAQSSEAGLLLRRALDLRSALKLGIRISLDEIQADEFRALMIIEEQADTVERQRLLPDAQR
jgi:hypothetical protein